MSAIHRALGKAVMTGLLVLAISLPVHAAGLERLAEVAVPVKDQSSSEREAALQTALREMLVRLSGSAAVLETSASEELLRDPSRYVQRFRYETRTLLGTPEADAAADLPGLRVEPVRTTQLMLHARFDIDALERRLRSYGLPVWGRERPRTLVLMAVDDPAAGRRVIGADHGLATVWQDSGERRGVPVQLPKMDAEDRGRIAVMDIWGVFEDPLYAAADRYDPNAMLVVSAWPASGSSWALRGSLLRENDSNHRWELQAGSLEAAVAELVDALAETYAEEFAVAANRGFSLGSDKVDMEIRDVASLEGYARVVDYVSGLSAVEGVQVVRVTADRVHLEVKLRGSREALEKAIALGRILDPVSQPSPTISLGEIGSLDGMGVAQPTGLIYRYRR